MDALDRNLELQGRALVAMAKAATQMECTAKEMQLLKEQNERLQLLLIWLMQRHRYDTLPVSNKDLSLLRESGYRIELQDQDDKHIAFIEQKATNLEDFKRELEILGKPESLPES